MNHGGSLPNTRTNSARTTRRKHTSSDVVQSSKFKVQSSKFKVKVQSESSNLKFKVNVTVLRGRAFAGFSTSSTTRGWSGAQAPEQTHRSRRVRAGYGHTARSLHLSISQ